jgi:excisionase family DNA binding protein
MVLVIDTKMHPLPSTSEVLKALEAARELNISYPSLLRLIKRRKIRCLPLRHKLIPRAELDRFLRDEIK